MKGLITVSSTWKPYAEVLCYNIFRLWEGRRWSLPEPKLCHISPEMALQRETLGILQWLSWYFLSWAVTIYLMLKPFIPFAKAAKDWGFLGRNCSCFSHFYWFFENFMQCILIIFTTPPSPPKNTPSFTSLRHYNLCVQFVLPIYSWMCDFHWNVTCPHPFREPTLPLSVATSCQYLLSRG